MTTVRLRRRSGFGSYRKHISPAHKRQITTTDDLVGGDAELLNGRERLEPRAHGVPPPHGRLVRRKANGVNRKHTRHCCPVGAPHSLSVLLDDRADRFDVLFCQCHGVAHVKVSDIAANITFFRRGLLTAQTTASGHSEEAHEQDRRDEHRPDLFLEAHENPFAGPTTGASPAAAAFGQCFVNDWIGRRQVQSPVGGMLTSLSGCFVSRLDWPWRVYLEKGLPLSLFVLAPQGHVSAGHGGTALTVDPLVGSNDVPKIT